MTRGLSLLLVFFAAVVPARAADIDVYSSINVSDPAAIRARGTAQYMDDHGDPAIASMSGNLTLYEGDALDPQLFFSDYWPWINYDGLWVDEFSHYGDYARCYQSSVVAHTGNVSDRRADSGRGCTRPPAAPAPHGYDICPILLDLDGGGIPTSGAEAPVAFFDTNHDGVREAHGWVAAGTEDAFLWMDVDGSGAVDPGELFGSTMLLPSGEYAHNGFQALSAYDENGDGVIDRSDAIWDRLRLWIDRDHDGQSSPHEISTPGSEQIIAFDLHAVKIHTQDDHGNMRMLHSTFTRRIVGDGAKPVEVRHSLDDIVFAPLTP